MRHEERVRLVIDEAKKLQSGLQKDQIVLPEMSLKTLDVLAHFDGFGIWCSIHYYRMTIQVTDANDPYLSNKKDYPASLFLFHHMNLMCPVIIAEAGIGSRGIPLPTDAKFYISINDQLDLGKVKLRIWNLNNKRWDV